MAKRVSLNEFKKIFDSGVEYPKRAVKELSVHKGYQIPKSFWTECLVAPARYGVTQEEVQNDPIIINENNFKVIVKRICDILTLVEVTHIENDQKALTTIGSNDDPKPIIERLMKSWSPYNTKNASLSN